ncbi:tRNA dihydrouridine synthase DusB [Chitinophaga nivalis]|uniref:tRNA-dihydrouridine synthase n=1 Tax=Chitinophaga nivalis TaxID=2991709 RepID=A0ABT3IUZ1_9BACT|nr:tRNA dihydrouridine synthase DusB [Chitinophaga nivalis]MCW3462492.1 tRNA dihydrouridine synthase DusB [Chitinophaga nivalis]MCW3487817.1 tRNA dihydrouridine synthase DusB [Chitinophaga nivalis]
MVKIGNIDLGPFPLLLAPMEDVSDPPFRAVCKDNGADLMYTEFISSEGLIRDAIKSRKKLDIFPYERPVGIQIFGGDEEPLAMAAQIVEATNPDLLDINFGCPVKKVTCKGAGAGILKDIPKMVKLTAAVVKATKLPVTVKTRLGWDDDTKNIEEVAERLQDVGIKALTIHGRTRTQMYKGNADWTLIGKVKNNPRIQIPIFGNGDICTPEQVIAARAKYGVDGVMIGRAAIGYPWIFREIKHFMQTGEHLPPPTVLERVEVCKKHLRQSVIWKGDIVGILEMRRHYTNYLKGLPHIKEFRQQLVTYKTLAEIEEVLDTVVSEYKDHIFERAVPQLAAQDFPPANNEMAGCNVYG